MKYLHKENYKSLEGKIKEDIRRWKDHLCSWINRINSVKMAILWNLYVQCNLHQNSNDILHRDRKSILKFIWKHKIPWGAKAIRSKKKNAGHTTIPAFQLYYRATEIKTSMVLAQKQRQRLTEQNRGPRNPHSCSHLISDKGTQNIS
jgi:hypothetical protein